MTGSRAGIHRWRTWLYRGGRPHRLAGLLNGAQAALAARGVGPSRVVALEVVGRRTGRTISLPLVVADLDGDRYLVSMLGQDASWVRNVRAAHGRAVLRYRRRQEVVLDEVDPAHRPPVLRRYLDRAPGARAHFPIDRRAPLEEFARIAERYPVFRVTVPASAGPPPRPRGSSGREEGCRFDLSVPVGRPPADVYAFLADVQDAEPLPRRAGVRMVKEPPGPTTLGTVWHEKVRLAPGLWLPVDSVVTEAQPPHRLGMDFRSPGFTGHLTYEVEPAAGGSVLRQREEVLPRRLLRPWRGVVARTLAPRLRRRLDDIRGVLEGEQRRPVG